jgi:hypothetical protein
MTIPADTDPDIGQHVVAIRDRFGVDGLREAAKLIDAEIAIFTDSYLDLPDPPLPGRRSQRR